MAVVALGRSLGRALRRAGAAADVAAAAEAVPGQDSRGDGTLIPNAGGKGVRAPNRPLRREVRPNDGRNMRF